MAASGSVARDGSIDHSGWTDQNQRQQGVGESSWAWCEGEEGKV